MTPLLSPDPLPVWEWVTWRVLGTGSRTWTNTLAIRILLATVWHPDATLITGACPDGADQLMEHCWRAWGGRIERHPADWNAPCRPTCQPGHRRSRRGQLYCPAAGDYRNQRMVDLGADICAAAIRHHSRGTRDTITRATTAGIPVIRTVEEAPCPPR